MSINITTEPVRPIEIYSTGRRGPEGPQGPQGPVGPKGDKGDPGQSSGEIGVLEQKLETAGIVQHVDTSEVAGTGGYDWRLFYQAASWSNGPPNEPNYVDDVFAFGLNMAAIGTRLDPDRQYAAWHMESKFYSNPGQAQPWTENFLHVVDTNGGVRRPIAWVGAHDGSYGNVALAASLINLNGNLAEPKVEFNFGNGLINVYDGLTTVHLTNGSAVHRQRNAANNNTIPLPYVDDGDNIVIHRPVTTAATAGTKNTNGPTFRSRGNINTALTVSAPGATNATMVLDCGITQSAGTTPIPVTANGTTTVTMAANAITEADIGRTITGANVPAGARIFDISSPTTFITTPALPATVTAVTLSARTKRSTEISLNASGGVIVDFTTNYQLRDKGGGYAINLHAYNGKVGFGPGATYPVGAHVFDAAVRFQSYTVATLPPAGPAGAGAIVYVSDASGGPTLACSDGAAWRVLAALGDPIA